MDVSCVVFARVTIRTAGLFLCFPNYVHVTYTYIQANGTWYERRAEYSLQALQPAPRLAFLTKEREKASRKLLLRLGVGLFNEPYPTLYTGAFVFHYCH